MMAKFKRRLDYLEAKTAELKPFDLAAQGIEIEIVAARWGEDPGYEVVATQRLGIDEKPVPCGAHRDHMEGNYGNERAICKN